MKQDLTQKIWEFLYFLCTAIFKKKGIAESEKKKKCENLDGRVPKEAKESATSKTFPLRWSERRSVRLRMEGGKVDS